MQYIWLLEPTEDGWRYIDYDCNCGFVVRAANAKEARSVVMKQITYIPSNKEPSFNGDESGYAGEPFWLSAKLASCKRVGTASNGGKSEVLLKSFRAG